MGLASEFTAMRQRQLQRRATNETNKILRGQTSDALIEAHREGWESGWKIGWTEGFEAAMKQVGERKT